MLTIIAPLLSTGSNVVQALVAWLFVLIRSLRLLRPRELEVRVVTSPDSGMRALQTKDACGINSLPDEIIAKIIWTACDPTTNPTQHQVFAGVSRRFRSITWNMSELWTHLYVGQSLDWLWHQIQLSKDRGLNVNFTRVGDVRPNTQHNHATRARWCANGMDPTHRCACLEFLIFVTEYNHRWKKFVYRIHHSSQDAQHRMDSLLHKLWLPRLTHLEMLPSNIAGMPESQGSFLGSWIMPELSSLVCTEGMQLNGLLLAIPPHLRALGVCSSFPVARLHYFRDLLLTASVFASSLKVLSLKFDGVAMNPTDLNLTISDSDRISEFSNVRVLSVHVHWRVTQQPFSAVLPQLYLPNIEVVFVKFELLFPEATCLVPFVEFGRWLGRLPTTKFRDLVVVVKRGNALTDVDVETVISEILECAGRLRQPENESFSWFGNTWSRVNDPWRFRRLIHDIDEAGVGLSVSYEELLGCVSFRSQPGIPTVHLAFQA